MTITFTIALVLTTLVSAASPQATKSPAKAAAVPDRATLLQQAATAQKSGRHDEAIRLYRLAAERHQSVQAYLELARLQSRTGDAASALTSLNKAQDLAPNSEDVLSAIAQVALAAKRPMPAVLTLQSLTRICPTVAQYHYLLGVGLMAVGDMPAADDALKEANRLEPEKTLTLIALGLVLNNRKQFDEAKTSLARSVELQPDSIEAMAALAEAHAGLREFDRATVLARRVLERAATNATANLVMGMILMEQNDYAGARDALVKATTADPDSPKAFYQLSLAAARLGDEAGAQRYVQVYQEKLQAVEDRVNLLRAGGSLKPNAPPRKSR